MTSARKNGAGTPARRQYGRAKLPGALWIVRHRSRHYGVVKQRVARKGEGKSGGFRTIVLFRRGSNAFFVYGFAKSDRDNIDRKELKAFRKLADQMLGMTDKALDASLGNGTITEIIYHD
jgi:hypothetical protein